MALEVASTTKTAVVKPKWTIGDLRATTRFRSSGHLGEEPQHERRAGRDAVAPHRFCLEPFPWYKSLKPLRPHWRNDFFKYHSKQGFAVLDTETISVPARDRLDFSRRGAQRGSDGYVTYSARHRDELTLDAEELARILRDKRPSHNRPAWSLDLLQQEFLDQVGRRGSWSQYNLPFATYLSLFPKTFETFGPSAMYVRVLHRSRKRILDDGEEVMVRLALAGKNGCVVKSPFDSRKLDDGSAVMDTNFLPDLIRVKSKYRSVERSHSEPLLRELSDDKTVKLPPVSTSPVAREMPLQPDVQTSW